MKFTSETIKLAWKLRKEAAHFSRCNVLEISWSWAINSAKTDKLEGSEKQIAWAEKIRAKMIKQIIICEISTQVIGEKAIKRFARIAEKNNKILAIFRGSSARAIIDNRYYEPQYGE
jgi:hypothetical protein